MFKASGKQLGFVSKQEKYDFTKWACSRAYFGIVVSEPGFFKVWADFGRISTFMWKWRSISNIVY